MRETERPNLIDFRSQTNSEASLDRSASQRCFRSMEGSMEALPPEKKAELLKTERWKLKCVMSSLDSKKRGLFDIPSGKNGAVTGNTPDVDDEKGHQHQHFQYRHHQRKHQHHTFSVTATQPGSRLIPAGSLHAPYTETIDK